MKSLLASSDSQVQSTMFCGPWKLSSCIPGLCFSINFLSSCTCKIVSFEWCVWKLKLNYGIFIAATHCNSVSFCKEVEHLCWIMEGVLSSWQCCVANIFITVETCHAFKLCGFGSGDVSVVTILELFLFLICRSDGHACTVSQYLWRAQWCRHLSWICVASTRTIYGAWPWGC